MIDANASPEYILQESYLIHSADAVAHAVNQIAQQINQDLNETPIVLVCVMTGGLYFSGQLLALLRMPVTLDYVHVSRYQHALTGQELDWCKALTTDIKGKVVLLVDDILDEGITLSAVAERCLALGASQVNTAVLVNKRNELNKPILPDYVAIEVPNSFVFGCGMDVYGWWRNLPEIRAI